MTTYNFDQLPERRDTNSAKWRMYPSEVLPMFVADMDFVSPQPVVEALQDFVGRGVFGYPTSTPRAGRVAPAPSAPPSTRRCRALPRT